MNEDERGLIRHLRALRLDQRTTLRQLAASLGVTQTSVINWEQGHNQPSAHNLVLWMKALGIREVHV